jgi:hypothetical protein
MISDEKLFKIPLQGVRNVLLASLDDMLDTWRRHSILLAGDNVIITTHLIQWITIAEI